MKKILVCLALAAGSLAAPVVSFAQSNAPVTRAEVRADLVRLEQAGYNPSAADDANYPADIQAAEAKVAAQETAQQATQAYGGVAQNGTSAAGAPVRTAPMHTSMQPACVGPVSFCNTYFGS
ncbi:DUF4148 domain-containing protein [Paraburkholderia saeva]|jgi:hypothetical protein|uniref:DUF4148 domain-containing protein n=1 Tax=Paraburkholderia saeva TaxID=2777537 RepID=A0A9N8RTF8_9BURK|nr:DUF4148 domain-containing protein [Paraburkholderia saeva]CAG4889943.1 hypothetical protein LMG31841_00935 [Paraburkholderia saeva]CAG4924555.1 hypothetical protein R70241_05277 [Paraburkholderia saeva]